MLGDRLILYIQKVLAEFKMMEHIVAEDIDRFGPYGLKELGEISEELRTVHETIEQDIMNGKSGVHHLIRTVFEPHRSFVNDLIATESFPEFAKLEEECR